MPDFYGTLAGLSLAICGIAAGLLAYSHQSVAARLPDAAARRVFTATAIKVLAGSSLVVLVASLGLALSASLPSDGIPSAGQRWAARADVAVMVTAVFIVSIGAFALVVAHTVQSTSPRGLVALFTSEFAEKPLQEHAKTLTDIHSGADTRAGDPLGALVGIAADALRRGDVRTWRFALKQVATVGKLEKEFAPEDGLAVAMAVYHIRILIDEALAQSKPALVLDCIDDLTEIVSQTIAVAKRSHLAASPVRLIQETGDRAIQRGSEAEALSSGSLFALGTVANEACHRREDNTFGDACRAIGWLGERASQRATHEPETLMPSGDRPHAVSDAVEVLAKIGETLKETDIAVYPIVFIDALEVIAQRVIERDQTTGEIRESIVFTLLSEIADLGITAVKLRHKMAWVCPMKLARWYAFDGIDKYPEIRPDIAQWLCEMTVRAVGVDADLPHAPSERADGKRDLAALLFKYLLEIGPEHATEAVRESYTRSMAETDHDARWEFVVRAGALFQTNFGYMFDWKTGELYPEDDPRRR